VKEVRVRVPAKVNLVLNVGATDNEGYHALGTLFQAVSLFDDLVARPAEAGVFRVSFRGEGASGLPTDDTNLVVRAARLLAGKGQLTFRSLVAGCDRLTTVVRFLAILELFRAGRVSFEQAGPLAELSIRWSGGETTGIVVDEYEPEEQT